MPIRTPWASLPTKVTHWVETELGGKVVTTVPQQSGFSSGSADRVVAENGRQVFVKTISRTRNAETLELHRREAAVMRMLPQGVPMPSLLGTFDDNEWIALMLQDIDGRHPVGQPEVDIPVVLDALMKLPLAEGSLEALPRLRDELTEDFGAWDRIAANGVGETLPTAALALSERMIDIASAAIDAVDGEHLVHLDCRADNILIDRYGAAWFIDWPWASVGARWFDGLTYLLDVVMRDEHVDVDEYLGHPLFENLTSEQLDAVLAALAGNWYEKAGRPAPTDMPGLRAFQRTEADAAVTWLARRWA